MQERIESDNRVVAKQNIHVSTEAPFFLRHCDKAQQKGRIEGSREHKYYMQKTRQASQKAKRTKPNNMNSV